MSKPAHFALRAFRWFGVYSTRLSVKCSLGICIMVGFSVFPAHSQQSVGAGRVHSDTRDPGLTQSEYIELLSAGYELDSGNLAYAEYSRLIVSALEAVSERIRRSPHFRTQDEQEIRSALHILQERILASGKIYMGTMNEFLEAGGVDVSSVHGLEDIQRRIDAAGAWRVASESHSKLMLSLPELLRGLLEGVHSVDAQEEWVNLITESIGWGTLIEIRTHAHKMPDAVIDVLLSLRNSWGAWKYDDSTACIVFKAENDSHAAERYTEAVHKMWGIAERVNGLSMQMAVSRASLFGMDQSAVLKIVNPFGRSFDCASTFSKFDRCIVNASLSLALGPLRGDSETWAAYGYVFGQEQALRAIAEGEGPLAQEATSAYRRFATKYASAEDIWSLIESGVPDSLLLRMEAIRDEFVPVAPSALEDAEARAFLDEVQERINGQLPMDVLRILLCAKPDYRQNPEHEFIDGFSKRVQVLHEPRAQGVSISYSCPHSWELKRPNSAHMCSVAVSQLGFGDHAFMVSVWKIAEPEGLRMTPAHFLQTPELFGGHDLLPGTGVHHWGFRRVCGRWSYWRLVFQDQEHPERRTPAGKSRAIVWQLLVPIKNLIVNIDCRVTSHGGAGWEVKSREELLCEFGTMWQVFDKMLDSVVIE